MRGEEEEVEDENKKEEQEQEQTTTSSTTTTTTTTSAIECVAHGTKPKAVLSSGQTVTNRSTQPQSHALSTKVAATCYPLSYLI